MKPKMILVSSAAVLAALAIAFFRNDIIKALKGTPFLMQAAVLLIGIVGGAITAYIWGMRFKKAKEGGAGAGAAEAAPPVNLEDLDLVIDEAKARLAAGELGKDGQFGKLPAVFIIGETGAAKTTTVVHSGLDAELLAGQVYEESDLVPTPMVNFWFARRTVFVEAAGKLAAGPEAWTHLVGCMQPPKLASLVGKATQPPRAALVCVEAESLAVAGGEEALAATARNLRARLSELSQLVGANLPVYVLFTKTDRIPFFTEYVRNLGEDEVNKALGIMLAPVASRQGIYAEEETVRLNTVFDGLFRSMANARPAFLSREHDQSLTGNIYEFPREFRKLRTALVRFLLELCRPSQLTVGPYLRGFYFGGVRPILVNEMAPAPAPRGPEASGDAMGATYVFRSKPGSQAAAAPQRVIGTRKVPQWVFLGRLFNNILTEDAPALCGGASARVSFMQRCLLGGAALLFLFYSVCLIVSFSRNRALETTVRQAAREIAVIQPAQANLAPLDSLQRLESMRQALETLTGYERTHPPLSYRWGLYAGDTLYPSVRKLYFDAFRKLLLRPAQDSMLNTLRGLPATPGPEYNPTYETLKAYLITTSNHDKSTRAFLSPVLARHWTGGRTVDAERMRLAQKQLDFYADELPSGNPFPATNDAAAIGNARRYLSLFGDVERVYAAMLADAGKNNPPIAYSKKFPNDFVIDTQEVAGPFSKAGWDFMKTALKNPARYAPGEQWVLGDQALASIDQAKIGQQLSARYYADFVQQWRAYLKGAAVMRYSSLGQAAKALNALSGNQSPLLALFWLASQNTAVDSPETANAFQPVQAVVPPASVDRYIAQPNQAYMNALVSLQAAVEAAAAQQPLADATASQTLTTAAAAKVAARQVAQGFRIDPEAHVEATVQKLLEDPITNIEALLRNAGPAELNGKGKGLCSAFRGLMSKYPFNSNASAQATAADLNAVFHKPDGALWAFYAASLQKVLPKQGSQYVAVPAGGINLNPAFVRFFNQAAMVSVALYAGGSPDPKISYSLKPVASEGIQAMGVQLDGQALAYGGGAAVAKPFVWQAGGNHEAKATVKFGGGPDLTWSSDDGLWAAFRFFGKAEQWQPAGGASVLEWVIRIGKDPVKLPSGKPLTVRFELNMGGGPELFQKGYFSRLACVADVAR
jgi:type VI secretion system protein ImpL